MGGVVDADYIGEETWESYFITHLIKLSTLTRKIELPSSYLRKST